jgi:5-hydroxyisourate hydrolase
MITTHVLDLSLGGAAEGVTVILEIRQGSEWTPVGKASTDSNGRADTLTEGWPLTPGTYRLTFDIATYHREQGFNTPFFTDARITFNVRDTEDHFHVPLLLSPYGFSTYRGT